jgi:transcription elongation GreA/GreB family factor
MSRAFVKENDLENAGIDIPERSLSKEPNYVTPNGLKLLNDKISKLEIERESLKQEREDPIINQKIAIIERDIRYFASRIESAILINSIEEDHVTVLFGDKVSVEDEVGKVHTFEIVGEDEADIHQSKVSYLSPLAKALIGSSLGDEVIWERPMSDTILKIQKINH